MYRRTLVAILPQEILELVYYYAIILSIRSTQSSISSLRKQLTSATPFCRNSFAASCLSLRSIRSNSFIRNSLANCRSGRSSRRSTSVPSRNILIRPSILPSTTVRVVCRAAFFTTRVLFIIAARRRSKLSVLPADDIVDSDKSSSVSSDTAVSIPIALVLVIAIPRNNVSNSASYSNSLVRNFLQSLYFAKKASRLQYQLRCRQTATN